MEMFQIISFKSLNLGGNVFISIGREGGILGKENEGGKNGGNVGGFRFSNTISKENKNVAKKLYTCAFNYIHALSTIIF